MNYLEQTIQFEVPDERLRHCVLFQTGDVPVCDPRKHYDCIQEIQAKYVRDNEAAKCNCPRQCHRLTYQPTVTQALMSISAATYWKNALKLNGTVQEVIEDHCLVDVGILRDVYVR